MAKHFAKDVVDEEELDSPEETTDTPEDALTDVEERLRRLDDAEDAIDAAFLTGRADRAAITMRAREDAREVVRLVGNAMDADEAADEAMRLAVITENMGDRERTKQARQNAKNVRRESKVAHKTATKAAKTAYNAIKFSQPGKLGVMRLVQVAYAANIAIILLALIMTSRDAIVYDSVTFIDWITIILQGIGFWFFINYFRVTKPFVIGVEVFAIASSVFVSIAKGQFSIVGTLFNNVYPIALILYFSFSKRVDAVLVNDFSSYRPRERAEVKIQRHGWPFVRNLIMYFIVFSVLGHWMEALMCQFIRLGLVAGEYDPTNTMLWRDWLYPYPMEGAAVVIIALVLYPLWRLLLEKFEKPVYAYVTSFVSNALMCTIIEFSMGLIVNADHQLWDYTKMFGNIMGQVCLQNTLAFGVAASIITWVVYPMMERWIARIPTDTMNIAFVVVAVIGGILWSLYIIDPPENHNYNGPTYENLEQDDRDAMLPSVIFVDDTADELERLIDNSEHLPPEEREELKKQMRELSDDVDAIRQILERSSNN